MKNDFIEIDFGNILDYVNMDEIVELLAAYQKSPITLSGIKLCHNCNSGFTFLSDENYDLWMMNGDKFEQFYACGNCGEEGFLDHFKANIPESDYCIYCKPWKYETEEEECEEESE